MAPAFEISAAGTEDTQARLTQLGADLPKVMTRALNRAMTRNVYPQSLRAIVSDTGLTPERVKKSLRVERATWARLAAFLVVTGRRVPLAEFGVSQTSSGVWSRLRGGTPYLPGAFIRQMKSTHVGVFKRRLPSERRSPGAWSLNLPIVERRGPSLPHAFSKPSLLDPVLVQGNLLLEKHLKHEIDYLLSQRAVASDAA